MSEPFCESSEVGEGQCKSKQINGVDIFILRKDGRIYAYVNSCPHLGIQLNWQADQFFDAEGELLVCASHGAMFTPDTGRCVSGPCLGQSLQSCPVSERGSTIFIETRTPPEPTVS